MPDSHQAIGLALPRLRLWQVAPLLTTLEGLARRPGLTILLAGGLLIASVAVDLATIEYGGGIDLRNRIVGARLLEAGLDPYHFKWNAAYPDRLLDPLDKPDSPVTRTMMTPGVLGLLVPLARLDYSLIRMVWLALEWGALAAIVGILLHLTATRAEAAALLLAGLLFTFTDAWRAHASVGQVYVFFALLLTGAYALARSPAAWRQVMAGVVLGITACLRPPAVLVAVPFLVLRRWHLLAGVAVGGAAAFLLSVAAFGQTPWLNYYRAVSIFGSTQFDWYTWPFADVPPIVEGMSNLTRNRFLAMDVSLLKIVYVATGYNMWRLLPSIIAGTALLAGVILYFHRRRLAASTTGPMLVGLSLVLLVDFLLPASRHVYQDVLWVPVAFAAAEHLRGTALGRANSRPWFWIAAGAAAFLVLFPPHPLLREVVLVPTLLGTLCHVLRPQMVVEASS